MGADQILVSLHPHQKRIFRTNPSRMRRNLSLILFGLLVLLALSAVRAEEEEEGNSLSEELAEARVARSPDAKRRRKMKGNTNKNRRAKKRRTKKAKKGKKARNGQKKEKRIPSGRRTRLQRKQEARGTAGLTDSCF